VKLFSALFHRKADQHLRVAAVGATKALQTMCGGGGMGTGTIMERLD
jgi:acetyl-CoA acetyltransferase